MIRGKYRSYFGQVLKHDSEGVGLFFPCYPTGGLERTRLPLRQLVPSSEEEMLAAEERRKPRRSRKPSPASEPVKTNVPRPRAASKPSKTHPNPKSESTQSTVTPVVSNVGGDSPQEFYDTFEEEYLTPSQFDLLTLLVEHREVRVRVWREVLGKILSKP